jgi:His-Xaa-Ser system radical SAM maturase HxsC
MLPRLSARGVSHQLKERTLARVTFRAVAPSDRADYFLGVKRICPEFHNDGDSVGYAAILAESGARIPLDHNGEAAVVEDFDDLSFLEEESVVAVEPRTGDLKVLFRPASHNNAIFATGRCNSNCLMCSQPPVLQQNEAIVQEHLRLVDLIKIEPESIGITGGEPTLLGTGLVSVLARLRDRLPRTRVHMLTNGRLYAYEDLVAEMAAVKHPNFTSGIPLYSDNAHEHDYIVQAKGAFDQTVIGFYNMAKAGLRLEIRIVLHQQVLPRLCKLVDFIYRNFPFADHIALMGLENMGYTKINTPILWTDPLDYSSELEEATRFLAYRQMNVSIYNLQLCVLPRSVWPFARKSISDYKNIYLAECENCAVTEKCGGLFKSTEFKHSRGIKSIPALGV